MAKRTFKAKSPPAPDPFGLRSDGGWGDAARADLADARERPLAEALLSHLAAARPRKPFADFNEAQRNVDWACLTEPFDSDEDEDDDGEKIVLDLPPPPVPPETPGTPQYTAALYRATPDEQWFKGLESLARHHGHDRVAATISRWIAAAGRSKPGLLNRPGPNRWLLHVAIFAAARLGTARCADALRQLAQYACDNKTAQGTTCATALALIETPEALGALHLLAERSQRPTHRQRFGRAGRHLQAITGISADEAAERFVPAFELGADGTRTFTIAGCSAELRVDRGRDVVVQWRGAQGKPVKSVPAPVRNQGPAALAEFKATAKSIEKTLKAHRERLDRLMIRAEQSRWALASWRASYADHPLVGLLARRLIWLIDGRAVIVPAAGGAPQDVKGHAREVDADSQVRVWHPALRPAGEVLAWRERLTELRITQPFKQSHREVYLLTDAERRTRTYSNRFAAHVIRQHQFRQLAMQRGWDAPLKMIHDGAFDRISSRDLPHSKLRAELWTEPAGTEEQNLAPSGAFLYIVTDQVRFYRSGQREPMPLEQVPPLVFSEIMRDVDLFVGVASVGNDPTWQDGGPGGHYRDYWQRASFGDIGESAKTRKVVLQRLVPRLKIADRCTLTDRFLVVRGALRTYRIHLGSGNILMEPNDQYLCIVPDRSRDLRDEQNVFLPFEEDAVLWLILSKAFLLAEDAAISDPTITRQIRDV